MEDTEKDFFSVVDYLVFLFTLAISAGIGIYYGFKSRNRSDTNEFLMGGRSLSIFPVAMSVLASFMSAITLLGTPAEVYRFGSQYVMINIAFCLVVPATAYLYLPVFYRLGLLSAYEYLELRFSRFVRTIGATVFWLHMMMYMPVVLYAPSLALAEVTGLSIWFSVLSVGLVCTFYTSIGGMKAVVLTDLFQSLVMYAAILSIVIKGVYDIGGLDIVWQRSVYGERIQFFNFDIDPTVRHTFWSLVIGGYITWMGNYAASQAMVQRYLTISTLSGAQWCLWINLPALILLISITSLAGLVIYAFYSTCDPIGTRIIDAPDQLFPRFVMETLRDFPGVPGLFVSGIFSGALSTVSSGVNSLAAVTLEDIIKTYIDRNITEVQATRITKLLALVYGLASIALVSVAQQLGGVLQATLTIHGIIGGPMLGLFSLGMLIPWSNTIGASSGVLSGFVVSMWLGMGAFFQQPFNPEAPRSYEICADLYKNVTGTDAMDQVYLTPQPNDTSIFPLYRISYMWLSAVGFLVTIAVGVFISLLSGPKKLEDIDEKLLSPAVLWIYNLYLNGRQRNVDHEASRDTSLTKLQYSCILDDDDIYPPKKTSSV